MSTQVGAESVVQVNGHGHDYRFRARVDDRRDGSMSFAGGQGTPVVVWGTNTKEPGVSEHLASYFSIEPNLSLSAFLGGNCMNRETFQGCVHGLESSCIPHSNSTSPKTLLRLPPWLPVPLEE